MTDTTITANIQPKQAKSGKKIHNRGFFRASFLAGASALPMSAVVAKIPDIFQKSTQINKIKNSPIKEIVPEIINKTGLNEKGVEIVFVTPYKKNIPHEELMQKLPINLDNIIEKYRPKTNNTKISNTYDNVTKKASETIAKIFKLALSPSKNDINTINKMLKNEQGENIINIIKDKTKDIDLPEGFIDDYVQYVKNMVASPILFITKNGNNSTYINTLNKLIVSENTVKPDLFKQIGHALNNNSGKIMKALQFIKPIAFVVPSYIALISFLNKRKVNDKQNKDDSKIQKSADFIKNNAGKLAFLSFVPLLLDETLATIKGNEIAKSLLSLNTYKKVKVSNLKSLGAYGAAVITAATGIHYAVKLKDNIQDKYEQKQKTKSNTK